MYHYFKGTFYLCHRGTVIYTTRESDSTEIVTGTEERREMGADPRETTAQGTSGQTCKGENRREKCFEGEVVREFFLKRNCRILWIVRGF